MPDSGGTVWQLLGMLFAVIVILAAAYFATKWIAARGTGVVAASRSAGGRLAVLAELGIGKGERLVLVRFMERCILLGVTASGVTVIKELDGEEAAEWFSEEPPRPSFLEALQENLRKKK